MITIKCIICGKIKKSYPSLIKTGHKFCGNKCRGISLMGKKLSKEHKQSISNSLKGRRPRNNLLWIGEDHPNWKGDNVGYSGLHYWIKNILGKATYCSNDITHKSRYFEWSNISGKYKRDTSDFKSLCVKCHRNNDFKKEIVIKNLEKAWKYNRGKHRSEETRRILSIALKGNPRLIEANSRRQRDFSGRYI